MTGLWSLPASYARKKPRAPGQKNKQPERSLQIRVATMLSWMLPPEVPWTSIAHGVYIPGALGRTIGRQLKACGLHPGFPDLMLIYRGQFIGIELKAGSSLSPEQREVHARIKLAGGHVAVCKSEEDVIAFLDELGVERNKVRLSPAERLSGFSSILSRGQADAGSGDK